MPARPPVGAPADAPPGRDDAAEPTVYLALGSNLGARAAHLAAAVERLRTDARLGAWARSPLYETDAVADHPQPPYLNAVLRARTALPSAAALLAVCLAVETALGRVRPPGLARAARIIDIDLLLFGGAVIRAPGLEVPHPRLLGRPFVRIPLADVAEPGLRHPVTGEALDVASPSPGVRLWSGG